MSKLLSIIGDAEILANQVQLTLHVLSVLILGAEHIVDAAPAELTPEQRQRWMIDRWLALLPELRDKLAEVDGTVAELLDGLTKAFPPRPKAGDEGQGDDEGQGEADEGQGEADDDTAEVAAAVDYASMHLWGAGVVPLILIFSEEEREQLGSTPLAHLSALLMSAAAGDPQALEQARELTRKLSEGAQMRTWWKPGELAIAERVLGVEDQGAIGEMPEGETGEWTPGDVGQEGGGNA